MSGNHETHEIREKEQLKPIHGGGCRGNFNRQDAEDAKLGK
jgi:hypothetical protein